LAFLRQNASDVTLQYRNHWNAGDLVMWDNRAARLDLLRHGTDDIRKVATARVA
jgi:Taurine catabolism dioxygenase TauD, TfdA family